MFTKTGMRIQFLLLQNARLEILSLLTKSLNLGTDVDLEKLAEITEGFTGADLQSVIYTAQLSTLECLLEENEVRIFVVIQDVPPKN